MQNDKTRAPGTSASKDRSRNWVFTLNNYTTEEVASINGTLAGLTTYLGYGRETGESGTLHLQGMCCFPNARRLSSVKALLPRAHLEIMRGTPLQSRVYCSKDGDYIEYGELPKDRSAVGRLNSEHFRLAIHFAKLGEFDEIEPELFLRYYATIQRIGKQPIPEPLDGIDNYWIYGKSNTGKSHAVFTQWPGAYLKPTNKWWDGYAGEETVWIDDVDPDSTSWIPRFLKIWGDKWAYRAEIKGGSLVIRPKRLVVTSNYSIDQMGFRSGDLAPIKRRFRELEKISQEHNIVWLGTDDNKENI